MKQLSLKKKLYVSGLSVFIMMLSVGIVAGTGMISALNNSVSAAEASNAVCNGTGMYVHFFGPNQEKTDTSGQKYFDYKAPEPVAGKTMKLGNSQDFQTNTSPANMYLANGTNTYMATNDIVNFQSTPPRKVAGRVTDLAGNYGNVKVYYQISTNKDNTTWNQMKEFGNNQGEFKLNANELGQDSPEFAAFGSATTQGGSLRITAKCLSNGTEFSKTFKWDAFNTTPVDTTKNPEGYNDAVTCTRIDGWAWDPKAPNTPIQIHFYVGQNGTPTKMIGSATANLPRPDTSTQTKDNGNHGYYFAIPADLKDGTAKQIFVYAINTQNGASNTLIGNQAYSITCNDTGAGQGGGTGGSSSTMSLLVGYSNVTPDSVGKDFGAKNMAFSVNFKSSLSGGVYTCKLSRSTNGNNIVRTLPHIASTAILTNQGAFVSEVNINGTNVITNDDFGTSNTLYVVCNAGNFAPIVLGSIQRNETITVYTN